MKFLSLALSTLGLVMLLFIDQFKGHESYPVYVNKAFKELDKNLKTKNSAYNYASIEVKPATQNLLEKFPPEMILLNEKSDSHLVLQIIDMASEQPPFFMGQISILDSKNNIKNEVSFYF